MDNYKQVAAACLVVSLALIAWLILSGFVTYAPSVSATEIKNIYLERAIWLGGISALLQLAALIAVLIRR